MSNRASTSRLSLEDWDALAPLSSQEAASISRIQAAASEKRIPPRVGLHADTPTSSSANLPTAQLVARINQPGSRPGTPSQSILRKSSHVNLHGLLGSPNGSPRPMSSVGIRSEARSTAGALDPLEITEPVATTQQFHDWFTRVEQSMEREQEEIYRQHLGELDEYIDSCDMVLEQLDDARGLLSEMEANYRFVEDNSRALQLACETMLDEQVRLMYSQ